MDECRPILNTGLRGFKVASSRISDVDGDIGKIIYRGYLIQDLAERASFEEIAYLLLYEKLPDKEVREGHRITVARFAATHSSGVSLNASVKSMLISAIGMQFLLIFFK